MPHPQLTNTLVKALNLDLHNYRTVQQRSEISAVEAMIVARGDWFWALMESLLVDGYLPTESIIVMRDGTPPTMTVREGNRRIAALKLIHGFLPISKLTVPQNIKDQIKAVSPDWRAANELVPCTIYGPADAATVDRIVRLAHGKGEKAGRDQWNAVARARHNRDENKVSEPALDLLEAYLKAGKNASADQKTRWGATYPLSVLDEAIKKLAPRLGFPNAPALATAYPSKVPERSALESIIADIGLELVNFNSIRSKTADFAARYGIPDLQKGGSNTGSNNSTNGGASGVSQGGSGNTQRSASVASASAGPAGKGRAKTAATSSSDPKTVRRVLKKFTPRGNNRMKVVDLKEEAERIDLSKTPLAFSFLLRSMFEISAKAYCLDHKAAGLTATRKDGKDKDLVEVLNSVVNHLATQPGGKKDLAATRRLHGAITELGKKDGLLSVTSLNQLVHNPGFHITPADVSVRFHNVFPLLEAMNE